MMKPAVVSGSVLARAALRAVCGASLLLPLAACGAGKCDENFKSENASRLESYTAALYLRECGLATESVSHVNLRGRREQLAADADGQVRAGEVFAVEGNHTILLMWSDDTHLTIACEGCGQSKVLKQERAWKDVQISYADR